MSVVLKKFDDFLNESRYWGTPTERTREVIEAFENTDAGRDLYALGVREIPERAVVKFERRGDGQSMPRTAIFKGEDNRFHIEHYSSKPGQEVYGEKSFDTIEECFRHLWVRLAKNIIPASLMSKREVEKKVNFDELFPVGSRHTQPQFLDVLKPIMGGEELAHPGNQDLLETDTIQKLLELALIGKVDRYGGSSNQIIVTDLSKNAKVKYKFYCRAAETIRKMYADLIKEIIGASTFGRCVGTMTSKHNEYESWTVTNTNRIPLNAVNYRTGENTLKCNVQNNEMMSAVFLSIIKRTFKRSKGKTMSEKIIWDGSEMVNELNSLMSDYFFAAASDLDPSVFVEKEFQDHPQIIENGKALLIKYLLQNGSMELKGAISDNPNLKELVEFTTSHENIDELTKKLIKASKLLKYI